MVSPITLKSNEFLMKNKNLSTNYTAVQSHQNSTKKKDIDQRFVSPIKSSSNNQAQAKTMQNSNTKQLLTQTVSSS